MPTECAATFDNITVADKALLVDRLTRLSTARMVEACPALEVAVSC